MSHNYFKCAQLKHLPLYLPEVYVPVTFGFFLKDLNPEFGIILTIKKNSMSNSRIPFSIIDFNQYFITTGKFLNAGEPNNAVRLDINEAEMFIWNGLNTRWMPLYLLYSDKANSRTQVVIAQLQSLMEEFNLFNQAKHILDRIASSANVTVVDLETFNIKSGSAKRTFAVQPIQESVITSIQLLGGGSLTIKCHANGKLRPGIIDAADCVQYVFLVGSTPPESADVVGLSKDISTKATFTLSLGSGSSSKNLYIYLRWYNSKHPELAGPWSSLQSTLIV